MKTIETEEDFADSGGGGWRDWVKWIPTSRKLLAEAERKVLDYVRTPFYSKYVTVPSVVGNAECKIWTLAFNETSEKTPLVLLHGLGSGVALWSLNLDSFAKTRPVYAFDFLGFGKSSRPNFSSGAMEAEKEFVASIEEWRKEMNLEDFILLGHSMGGFLATSYALEHPERVKHLILADPWGFPEKPVDFSQRYPIPFWVKAIAYVLQPLNPLWGVRFAGPVGPRLIEKVRPDLINKFASLAESTEDEVNTKIAEYIFHCNAQSPTGESAFHSMMNSFGWAKYPMAKRIPELHKDVPLTMIYGSRSWVDNAPGAVIQHLRSESYVQVEIIQGAGHHVYADKKDQFNDIVLNACEREKELGSKPSSMSNKTIIIEDPPVPVEEKKEKEIIMSH